MKQRDDLQARAAHRADMQAKAAAEMAALEHFQQKCEAVLRPEMRQNREIERFRDSEKSGNALGIDGAFLDRMVDTFYGRVRAHAVLGPVFERRLSPAAVADGKPLHTFPAMDPSSAAIADGKPLHTFPAMADEDRWPEHLATLKRFWRAVALRDGGYGGQPVKAHLEIEGIGAALFSEWLALFASTLEDIAPPPAARDWLYSAAGRIARSLTASLPADPATA